MYAAFTGLSGVPQIDKSKSQVETNYMHLNCKDGEYLATQYSNNYTSIFSNNLAIHDASDPSNAAAYGSSCMTFPNIFFFDYTTEVETGLTSTMESTLR